MAGYPVEIRRCQHIKTNGTQCGAPALREKKFCYHHEECRPERVTVKGADGKTSEVLVPVLEDAHSIQSMVRQVVMLMLDDRLDDKKAGRVLYALQIASANLKRMEEEKPRPVQVVVDMEKVGETPVGMTPWSGKEEGHELEESVDIAAERALQEVEQQWKSAYKDGRGWVVDHVRHIDKWLEKNEHADRTDLLNFVGRLEDNMKEAAKTMGRNLEKRFGGWPVRV